jgi:hypothetical protein
MAGSLLGLVGCGCSDWRLLGGGRLGGGLRGLLGLGCVGLDLGLGLGVGLDVVLRDDGRVRRGLVLGDDGVGVVLPDGRLGGDYLGDGFGVRLGGLDAAVNGLDLLGLGRRRLGCGEQFGLPRGERLDGFALCRLLVTLDEAFGSGIRNDAGEQSDGADGVVVARDRVLDLVRVAVGVEDRDDRDAELVRLVDGEVLLLGVDDPDRGRGLREVAAQRICSYSNPFP